MISENDGVSVFWDFASTASTSAASAISTYEMVKNIRFGIASYGSLRSIDVYWDFDGCAPSSSTTRLRTELSASGASLIDCPGQGREGAAIKKMLANMIFYAWEHPAPNTFVVITADRDIAYALAMLEIKNHRVVLISPAGTHPDLTSQASVQLDWSRMVLGTRPGVNHDTKLGDGPSSHMRSCPTKYRNDTFDHHQVPFTRRSNDFSLKERGSGSAFLKHNDIGFDPFGREDLHIADTTSPKTMGSLGLGYGPHFPHPQSRQAAATASCTTSGSACGKEKADAVPKGTPVRPPPRGNVSQLAMELLQHTGPARLAPTPSPSEGGQPRKNSASTVVSRPVSQQSNFSYIDVPASMPAANEDDGQQLRPVALNDIFGGIMPHAGRSPPNITLAPAPLPDIFQPVTPEKSSISPTPAPLPEKWVPLIEFLRKSQGVARTTKFMAKLLKNYPQATVRAGCAEDQYIIMAIEEGIVTRVLINGKMGIKLSEKYAL